jgi:hypothetical protein
MDMKAEGFNSGQLENELKKRFIRVQPDENFVRRLSQRLFEKGSISLESSSKLLYILFLIIFGFLSGYLIVWVLKKVFRTKPKDIP